MTPSNRAVPTLPATRREQDFAASRSDSQVFLYIAIALAMLGVLGVDYFTPLGIAVWVVYLIPVSLSLWLWQPVAPLWVAGASTVLMIVTFLTDTAGVDRLIAQLNRGFGILTIWTMALVGYSFIRNRLAVRRQQWLQTGQTGLSEVLRGDLRQEQLGANVLRFLAEYLDAHAGAMFVSDEGAYQRIAVYGLPAGAAVVERFVPGEGLLGQAAQDLRSFVVRDVPAGYLHVGSGLGHTDPRALLVSPTRIDSEANGVVELGFLHPVDDLALELMDRAAESIGVAVRSANYRKHLHLLLEETQRQAEELQVQSEELRVSNEELEEQSRALKESQARLEEQQAELEQTNSQLEEQAGMLESQRDNLAYARRELEQKATDLERASQYKSDFLANMSHELRTPLNSSLILAKLLADNPQGNLTED